MLSRTGWMSGESLLYISALVMLNWNLSHTESTSLASRESSSNTLGLRLADWNLGLDFIVFRTLARSSNKSFSTFSWTGRILLVSKYVNCKWVNAKCKIWIVLMSSPDRKWSNHKEQERASTLRPDPDPYLFCWFLLWLWLWKLIALTRWLVQCPRFVVVTKYENIINCFSAKLIYDLWLESPAH